MKSGRMCPRSRREILGSARTKWEGCPFYTVVRLASAEEVHDPELTVEDCGLHGQQCQPMETLSQLETVATAFVF